MILEGVYKPDLTEDIVYFYRADMTVAATANVSAERITIIDGSPRWMHTTKGTNAAGQIVWIKTERVLSKPSFIP